MNKASLAPAVIRMVTLTSLPLLTYFGVTQYNELNKVELPELPVVEEVEPEVISPGAPQKPSETPVKKTRKVWRQTAGRKFDSVFKVPKGLYSEAYLQGLCKSKIYIPVIFRNWCAEAKFELKEE